jgi:hypothetical protein
MIVPKGPSLGGVVSGAEALVTALVVQQGVNGKAS